MQNCIGFIGEGEVTENMLSKDKVEWQIWKDVYNLMGKFYDTSNNPAYWDALISDGEKLCEKYRDNVFCKSLVFAVLDELERKQRNTK